MLLELQESPFRRLTTVSTSHFPYITGGFLTSLVLAMSTQLMLGGKTPGEYNSALLNKRVKRDLVRAVKVKKNPAGLGVPGTLALMTGFWSFLISVMLF